MKAIIVSDAELRALLQSLKLHALQEQNVYPGTSRVISPEIEGFHRGFYYVVTKWIQSVGGDPRD